MEEKAKYIMHTYAETNLREYLYHTLDLNVQNVQVDNFYLYTVCNSLRT